MLQLLFYKDTAKWLDKRTYADIAIRMIIMDVLITNCWTFTWKKNTSKSDKTIVTQIVEQRIVKRGPTINYTHFWCIVVVQRNLWTTTYLYRKTFGRFNFLLKKMHLPQRVFICWVWMHACFLLWFFFLIFNLFLFQWKNLLDWRRRQAVWYRRLEILFLKPTKDEPFFRNISMIKKYYYF